MADFYKERFGVTVNPQNELLPLIGSKEGIMHISLAFLNVGDGVLVPNPGYPTYTSVTRLIGAIPMEYDLMEENGWLPDLEAIEQMDLSNVKLMWISYPNMPTGAKITMDKMEALLTFARKHNILLVNDNPYSFVLNDTPTSILQISGAKDHALELNSLSKTFNLAGWRVGMVMGSAEHILAVLKVKSNMDSGMFLPAQKAAIKALQLGPDWFQELNAIYTERRSIAFEIFQKLECLFHHEQKGMFAWGKVPKNIEKVSDWIDELIHQAGVFITPGFIFGEKGDRFIRISLCSDLSTLSEALSRINNYVKKN